MTRGITPRSRSAQAAPMGFVARIESSPTSSVRPVRTQTCGHRAFSKSSTASRVSATAAQHCTQLGTVSQEWATSVPRALPASTIGPHGEVRQLRASPRHRSRCPGMLRLHWPQDSPGASAHAYQDEDRPRVSWEAETTESGAAPGGGLVGPGRQVRRSNAGRNQRNAGTCCTSFGTTRAHWASVRPRALCAMRKVTLDVRVSALSQAPMR